MYNLDTDKNHNHKTYPKNKKDINYGNFHNLKISVIGHYDSLSVQNTEDPINIIICYLYFIFIKYKI